MEEDGPVCCHPTVVYKRTSDAVTRGAQKQLHDTHTETKETRTIKNGRDACIEFPRPQQVLGIHYVVTELAWNQ